MVSVSEKLFVKEATWNFTILRGWETRQSVLLQKVQHGGGGASRVWRDYWTEPSVPVAGGGAPLRALTAKVGYF